MLSHLRVLEVATYIAAPAAATIMSDFGAEVIKIERPPHGDPYRYLSRVPGMPESDELYCWTLEGRNKKSVALDLAHPESREVLEKLAAQSDVLLTNYQPSLRAKFRIRYEDIKALNPGVIYASLTGYGESGPDADKPGFDATAYWARSGLMYLMHPAGSDPIQSPAGFGDHPTASALFGAIMLALYQRERTGKGAEVSTSLLANGAWSNSCQIQAALGGAHFLERRNRSHPNNPLVNHYKTSDGHRVFFCLLEPQRDWHRLCRALNWTEFTDDSRFTTPASRRANALELVALLDEAIARRTLQQWTAIFEEHEVIWGPVPGPDQWITDNQMQAAGIFVDFEDTGRRTVNSPIRVEGVEKRQPHSAPRVGQHTREVLNSLGYAEDRIRQLADAGVVIL